MRLQWLDEGKGLFEQAKSNNDLEKMIYVGRQLVDSGRLDEEERVQMTRHLVALYHRVSRWAPAIELWETLAGSLAGDWEYHQTLAKLYANKGDYIAALEALEEGSKTVKNDDQRCLHLAV